MDILKSVSYSIYAIVLSCLFCTSSNILFPSLPKPVIQNLDLAISEEFKEAVHISWTTAKSDSASLHSFTLLRMIEQDSFYSIHSENIPADVNEFYDLIEPSIFPASSAETNSIYYRIIAVDDLGRLGDTSEACTLSLVQQPSLDTMDTTSNCLSWLSNIHLGGLISYIRIWKDSLQNGFTGSEQILFPATDKSAIFSTCFAPISNNSGQWHYAIFIKSADARSLRIGYFDVP